MPPKKKTETVEAVETEKSLVNIEALKPAEVFAPAGGQFIIDTVSKEVAAFVPDISTKEGRSAIIKLEGKIASTKTGIEKMRTGFTEEARKKIEEVNAEGKRIKTALEEFQVTVYLPLQNWKDAEKRRIDTLEEKITEIKAYGDFSIERTSEQLEARLEEVTARLVDGFEWDDDFKARAEETFNNVIDALKDKIQAVKKYETEQAELAQLRKEKADREAEDKAEQLRKDGEERAKKEQADREQEIERQKVANEQNRVNLIKSRIADLTLSEGCGGWSSVRIDATLKAIEATYSRGEFAELSDTAKITYENSKDLLTKELTVAKAREEKAEQDRKDKEAADRQAAIDAAAAKATKDAQAEQDRQKQKEKDDAAARERDKEHRARVNNAALDAMKIAAPTASEDDLKAILKAIVLKQVPNISIQY